MKIDFGSSLAISLTPINDVTFSSRTRLEECRREDGDEANIQFRQMLETSLPLRNHPTLSVVAYEELFVDLNSTDWGLRRGIDQNRAFIGVNWAAKPNFSLATSYLNQFVNTNKIDKENHVLATKLNLNF